MFRNVVVGKPLVDVRMLLSENEKNWERNEKKDTFLLKQDFFRRY